MPQYKLLYFNNQGLAELPRLIFHWAGVTFEDVRFERSEWPQIKPNTPFERVPVLEVDGKQLAQSFAISRYIARANGLAGDNEWDQALTDMYADCVMDITREGWHVMGERDPEKRKAAMGRYVYEKVTPHLEKIEAHLGKNGGFLVGQKVTWAEIAYYTLLSYIMLKHPTLLKDNPNIKAMMDRIENHPNIKKYFENRPPVSSHDE